MTNQPAPSDTPNNEILGRIKSYLSSGGLFNPEMANHDAVRDLLIDCRGALTEYAQLRDAEIARLEEEIAVFKETQKTCLESARVAEAEIAQLRARLAEAIRDSELWKKHLDNTRENTLNMQHEIDRLTAHVLALESQCQRMRDALGPFEALIAEQFSHDDFPDSACATVQFGRTQAFINLGDLRKAGVALDDPLDLELLNRVRSFVSDVADCEPEHYGDDCTCITCGAKRLLKSLSPAP